MAGLLRLEPPERAALSNWTEPVQDASASRSCRSMGVRYDGAKVISSLQAKVECISAARAACEALDDYSASYASLSGEVPSRVALRSSWTRVGVGLEAEVTAASTTTASAFPLKPASFRPALAPGSDSPQPPSVGEVLQDESIQIADEGKAADDSDSSTSDFSCSWDDQTMAAVNGAANSTWVAFSPPAGGDKVLHTVLAESDDSVSLACERRCPSEVERYTGWTTVMMARRDFCAVCKGLLPCELRALFIE